MTDKNNVPDLNIAHDNDGNPIYQGGSTLFDENGYDEMQRTENHEIGFKLFRIMFFAVLGFALVLIILCSTAEYFAGTVVSLVLLAAVYGFYIVYAYLTAKKGIMNPKFAKSWSGTWVIVCYAVLMLFWIGRLIDEISSGSELYDAVSPIVWLILITEAMLMCLCAKKNNKVLAEQLKEEQE